MALCSAEWRTDGCRKQAGSRSGLGSTDAFSETGEHPQSFFWHDHQEGSVGRVVNCNHKRQPGLAYWGTRRQRPYRLELGNDELIVREADGTEYAVPLGHISRIRIGVFAEEGWRAELARTSRLYPSLRFWIGDAPVGMRLYAYGDDPGFRTFMRALAAAVLRDHRFTTLETGEDDIRTYGTALVGLLCAIAVPVLFAQGITSGDASRLAGSAMCGAVAAMAYIEAFRRWPRRAGTMKVVDAALLTQHVPSE